MRFLLIDNRDSFTANLEHWLAMGCGAGIDVISCMRLPETDLSAYDLLVISPGPGKPSEYPWYAGIFSVGRRILGICLGAQIINEHFGGSTSRLPGCVHGKADVIDFAGKRFPVGRYHSLHMSRIAPGIEVIAVNAAGIPMAIRHKTEMILGLQFHPESFLTSDDGVLHDYALRFFGFRH